MNAGLVVGVVVALTAALGLGIIVGHFAVPKSGQNEVEVNGRDLGDCTKGCESEVRPEDIPAVKE